MIDDDMKPNLIGWMSDTPSGVLSALSQDERTRLVNGTSLSFSLGDTPKEDLMELMLCSDPQRHVHATFSVNSRIAHCSVFSVITYTIALALDQTNWKTPTPRPEDVKDAWEDVIQGLHDVHPEFCHFLLEGTAERGHLGDPSRWITHLKDHLAYNVKSGFSS